jgi:hypothetical protein
MLVFHEVKKTKYSEYDLTSLLYSFVQRVAMTLSREDGFGTTNFSVAGSPEDFKFIRKIVSEMLQRIDRGESCQNIVKFEIKQLFPKVNLPKLIMAIKQNRLSYQNYNDSMIYITVENTLPEFIQYFLTHKR